MTGPIIPAGEWPTKAAMHSWERSVDGIEGEGYWTIYDEQVGAWTTKRSGLPMPAGHDWRVPVMRPTVEDSSAAAQAIDLEQFRPALYALSSAAATKEDEAEVDRLLALIDRHSNVRSSSEHSDSLTPVAHKKLQGLQDEGFIVNGVAIFNPITGRRGLVDYLGYVGWQTSEQPSVTPVPPSTVAWHPIETAPKDNKRPLYLAQFNTETGDLIDLDWDASWEPESESWEIPQVYYIWRSANGRVEEPTHWAYQDLQQPVLGEVTMSLRDAAMLYEDGSCARSSLITAALLVEHIAAKQQVSHTGPAIDLEKALRDLLQQWGELNYPMSYEGRISQDTLDACVADVQALIDVQATPRPLIARQLAEWHEDDGPAMWWAWCGSDWAGEPAWCGTPNDSDWPGYHTHWTSHPAWPMQPTKGEGE